MDETPVFLDLVPNKVVDQKGKKTVRVRTTNSEKNLSLQLSAVLQQENCYHLASFLREKPNAH